MDLMNKRIVADPKRRDALIHAKFDGDDPLIDCQTTFYTLYINRGRTLGAAAEDADHVMIKSFMQKLITLFERGVIEIYDDRIYLPLKPDAPDKDAISKLADVLNKSGRWKP